MMCFFPSDTQEMHKGNRRNYSGTAKHRVPSELTTLPDSHRNPQDYDAPPDRRPHSIQSFRVQPREVLVST